MTHKHLLVAVVSYFDEINRHLYRAIHDALGPLAQMGWGLTIIEHVGNADLGRARNAIVAQFLASTADALLCIDSDVSWAPGSIERLVSHPVDLVAGCYPQRADEGAFPVRWLPETGSGLTPIDPVTGQATLDGLLEVEGVPAGFLKLSRAGLERVTNYYADTWYHEPLVPTGKAWSLFEFRILDRGRWSEDLSFCRMWRETGAKVWLDPLISLHHHGRKTYSGCIGNWLRDRSLPPAASLPGARSPAAAAREVLDALAANHAAAQAAKAELDKLEPILAQMRGCRD